ncbi:MAG TPA: YezD family protein [Candidatus Binataceae bacterium]|nr:YezD family protein [Candidatus Binataceae bacterium]
MNEKEASYGNSNLPPQVLERISQAIRGLRFGSVEVVIQDGMVIQIERKEKFRFDRPNRT